MKPASNARGTFATVLAMAATTGLLGFGIPVAAGQLQQHEVQAAMTLLAGHYDEVARRMGPAGAADLQERLNTDYGAMLEDMPPTGYPPEDWHDRLNDLAALDTSLVAQAIAGKSEPITSAHGAVERLILARSDHTLQPYSLYVPAALAVDTPLIVLLHGRPQTEAEIMASPYFRKLADETGAIVAAPYGRAIYDFAPPADDEVYQVADEVAAAFHIPARRTYLVGYSMGGFSVFKIAPQHPEHWAAVMSIAGSVLYSEADVVSRALHKTPLYVVTGTSDESIPTSYPQRTASYLASSGVPTGLYVQKSGTHFLATLMPVLGPAWHDMLAGKIPASARPQGIQAMPAMIPPPPSKAEAQ